MAPALVDNPATEYPYPYSKKTELQGLDTKVFPDGLKTSGQHPAIPSLIRPYEDFPKEISGPTVWRAEDYRDHPERWIHIFSDEEVAELSRAADDFIAAGNPLTGISKYNFHLPTLDSFFATVKKEITDGKGFILFKGIPVQEWGLQKSATVYMGIGTRVGYFLSQNGRGHVLGHVKDLGEDPTQPHKVRIYRTNAKQFYHTDGGDFVGLLCIAKALEGGESDIISTHHVFNTLQRENPEVIRTMVTPNWYFDRKGEVSEGMEPYYRSAILFLENDPQGSPRVWARHDPMNLWSLQRFSEGPDAVIPPLSEKQQYALKTWDETCSRLSLHMILDPGDIQLLANSHVYHARTAYKDYPPGSVDEQGRPRVRRHLMRLWLGNPEEEGGWKIPLHDSREKKRGGIQVNDTAPVCPLDAE
ncbi:Clavaminate synthase-like protein [Polychaeton citri CBS 116435]|uniref:Clavaminate synthase-like protein n=1 Tax=Polychaeton citri CBS 116435 TaxID=1314669 RepID=A0A9P4PWC7_9PEZI|nr:Clavaminate synthase-like protein [Polychaeton citri CBS 116435]